MSYMYYVEHVFFNKVAIYHIKVRKRADVLFVYGMWNF